MLYPIGLLRKSSVFHILTVVVLFQCSSFTQQSWGQTILFNDNFNTSTGALYDVAGAIGSSADWLLTRSGTDWGARITGGILDFSNTATGSGGSNGWVFGYRDINALSGWSTTLASNTGPITWEFNMRQLRTDPGGFVAGSYGVAFVLAGTSTTAATSGSGYAVVLGQSGTTDPVRLASFSGGLQGTLTNIITSNTSGLTDFANEYISVRVTYTPTTNTWQLFLRLDGTSFGSITDPATGTLTSQGTAVNSTFTSTVGMRYIGGYWQGGFASNQTAFFDNVYLKKTNPSFTVTFNGNGATSGTMANQTASAASNLTANAYIRTGYTFAGWATSAAGPVVYANSASYPFSANITLFAVWVPDNLTITYNTQGGSAISNGTTVTGGSIATSPGTPSRAGYTFNGWFIASSGGAAISFPFTHNQTSNFTLFAQWTANTLTVTFDSQGGSAISNGTTVTGGTVVNPGSPSQAGLSFNGWYTTPTGGTAIVFPYTHGETTNFTLYAQWIVVGTPTLTTAVLAGALSTVYGTASPGDSFTATGTSLLGNIIVTAQSGYEVSTTAGSGYGTSVSVSNGTTVWVRFAPLQNAGTYNNAIAATLSSSGAADVDVLTSGSGNSVTPKPLSVSLSSIASREYDGTSTAGTVTVGALSGLVGTQTVVAVGTAANYSSANVGTYNGVSIVYILSDGANGGMAANYSLADGTATGVITPKTLTITAPTIASKIYDATTTAGSVTVGTLSGFVGAETVIATATAAPYASANVGIYNNVVISYSLANGANGGLATNYTLAAGTATGEIIPRTLTITATGVTKEIGVVLSGAAGSTAFIASGLQGGQTIGSVTIDYGPAGSGTGEGAIPGSYPGQVVPSDATGGTFNAANYTINYVGGTITVTNPVAVILATTNTPVCQDFASLANSGTSSSTPTGWFFSESGSSANSTYSAGTGSSSTGDTYSFGTGTDRTFGGLLSNNLSPVYGARVYNNTGSTISVLNVQYTGKTWRVGSAGRSDRLDFQYSTNATSLTSGTWVNQNNLDYVNPGQATGSGSILHSDALDFTLTGLSIAPGASFWIRWVDFDASGSDDGMGVDDVCITAIDPCINPDQLAFVNQPSNVLQDAVMSAVSVRVLCSGSGFTDTGYTGSVTLSASNGGCGYVSQTVAAVNGVATFNSIVFTRSFQDNITLTASAAGFTSVVSDAFDVTEPAGTPTIVSANNFDGSTSLTYSTSIVGAGVFNTANTRGVGASNALAFYYNDCLTGASGSASSATFSQTTGLTGLSSINLTFSMAWGGPQLAGANCDATGFSGAGLDSDDFVRLETRINGGAFTTTFQLNGASNKQFPFSTSAVSLNHNANQTLSAATEPSAFTILLPSGTSSVEFRFTFKTNRRNEIIILDDFVLTGLPPGAPRELPVADAGLSFNGCNGGPNQLQGSATNTIGTVNYNWTPALSLNNATVSNPQATNTTTTTYVLTITDGDNCTAVDNVTVSVLTGTAGLWTGAENSDWFNCQNWASGNVPTSSTDVVIPDVVNDPDIASGVGVCRNITLSTSGSLLTMSGATAQLNVHGNLVNNGTFNSLGSVHLVGSASQSISGNWSFNNVTMNNTSGVILNNNVTIAGVLTLSNGNINAQNYSLIVTSSAASAVNRIGSGHIIGVLNRAVALGSNVYEFPVGDATAYTPASVTVSAATVAGALTVQTIAGDHPLIGTSGLNSGRSVNRFWDIQSVGLIASDISTVLGFVASDIDPGANTSNFIIQRLESGTWNEVTTGVRTATTTQGLSTSGYGAFIVGECRLPNEYSVGGGGSYCAGGAGVMISLSGSDLFANYQLIRNGQDIGPLVQGTGSAIDFGNQVMEGQYSVVAFTRGTPCFATMNGAAQVFINAPVTPEVSIAPDGSTIVCGGGSVVFNAMFIYEGVSPTFQWLKNGLPVGVGGATYTDSGLVNGDEITVVMTSGLSCVTTSTATSNTLIMSVNLPSTWYRDLDGDGYGDAAISMSACEVPLGYVANASDCDDTGPLAIDRFPGNDEYCDNLDNDCDAAVDEGLTFDIYYQDADGDGQGNPAIQQLACTAPSGFVSNNTDCDDACVLCFIGAVEILDGVDNDCDVLVDEGFGPVNDDKFSALVAVQSTYGLNCTWVNGTLLGATPSPEATSGTTITGEDVWYRFIAVDTAYSITVTSANYNIRVELHDDSNNPAVLTLLDAENFNNTVGDERLNFIGLVPGRTYFLCVRNVNAAQAINAESGTFQLCIQPLPRGGYNGGIGNFGPFVENHNLCDVVNARFTRANQYRFEFRDLITNATYNGITANNSTLMAFNSIAGLIPGRQYELRIFSIYNTMRGDNTTPDIVECPPLRRPFIAANPPSIPQALPALNYTATITVNPHANLSVRSLDVCPTNRLLTQWIAAEPNICAAQFYEWRFTRVLPSPGLPINWTSPVQFSRWVRLQDVPGLQAGATYDVEIRPIFTGGFAGAWSTVPSCVRTIGPAMPLFRDEEELSRPEERSLVVNPEESVRANVFPNPTTGEVTMLEVVGYTGQVQLTIYNSAGQLVYTRNHDVADGEMIPIDLQQVLSNGLYNVIIHAGDRQIKRKLMVAR